MRVRNVPVLVVGGGPVGLSTGMFLALWGVRPLVVDKRDPLSAPPRAGTSLRTMEIFRSMGLESRLKSAGWRGGIPMRTIFKDSGLGATLHRGGLPPAYTKRLETCSPADPRLILTQDQVQRVALDTLRRHGGEARFDLRLLDLRSEEHQVRARVLDVTTGAEQEITADYVIGADGANSEVRERLGISLSGREAIARLNTAFFRADLGPVLDDWGTHMCIVRNDAIYATLLSKNGRDQWSSHIMDYPGKPDELTDLSAGETIRLLRIAIGDAAVPIELYAVNAWEAAVGMASAFRENRIFLAGDAAHVQSSAGGLGMNTGIQDGHNLAWKLAAVLKGELPPALLDTYEPERRVAARHSLAVSRGMHHGYRSQEGDPAAMYERIAKDYLRGMMFYSYDVPSEVLDDEIRPGLRFPHWWVDGGRVSTLDLIGARWTLFTGSDEYRWRAAAAGLSIAPRVHVLDAAEQAVLVRPDGFVAWAGSSEAALRDAVGRLAGS
ncbi:FAD-dependent monooxygenase [Nonomuraea sp. NPDC049480]|uniref:FAD-dependent monooxygenase n=1 Tax=Nonomuraea sp. NPDC049480 TaxID=3364353 RepID=UPI00378D2F58